MIKITDLYKSYGKLEVLKGVSAEIEAGECVAIIGGSGTGKSVFLRSLAMLEKPDSGSIIIDGEGITAPDYDLNKMREKMGMVYQGFHLFSHLNVLDNITLAPRKVLQMPKKEAEKKAFELLELVGLSAKAGAVPAHLSGGQSQRIAIARCLAMEPKIILFDEPTSALDPTMVGEVLAIIRKLLGQGITMLIVTHEMSFAQDVASRVFYMDEGIVYEQGTPEQIFSNPQRIKTINFIRKLKLLEYDITDHKFDLIAMFSQVEFFCTKYGLGKKLIFTTQLILEEVITTLLAKYYTRFEPEIRCTIEYSESDNNLNIYVQYRGENKDIILSEMDDIQKLLIKGKTKAYSHSYSGGDNKLIIKV